MEAMAQFEAEQQTILAHRHESEAGFVEERDRFFEIEAQVEEKVEDAVRRAQAEILEAEEELD
jgi:hypothetical protein